jgi:hypothetical protein
MAAISAWISCSVFSGTWVSAAVVELFSWSPPVGLVLDFEDLVGWKIWTWLMVVEPRMLASAFLLREGLPSRDEKRGKKGGATYVELPPLNALACVLVGDDNDELGDLTTDHPLVQLRHDLLYVRLDLIIRRDYIAIRKSGSAGLVLPFNLAFDRIPSILSPYFLTLFAGSDFGTCVRAMVAV